MDQEKLMMAEAASLYYEKKYTQQEIAELMKLSRQTVSKLLNNAVRENIVEIRIHDPRKDCEALQEQLCAAFGLRDAVVCGVSGRGETLRQLMTVKAAAGYLVPVLQEGGNRIALSWGRTVQALVGELPEISSSGNEVFPLFGATDLENSCFSSNELVRAMADKVGAAARYAWFPYLPDHLGDRELLKKTSYYKRMQELWDAIDIAVVGIGNTEVLELFGKTFGLANDRAEVVGDVATHFFNAEGGLLELYENMLCASAENLRNAGKTVAVACGDNKASAIIGALRTGLIDVLVTDEYTAGLLLERAEK